MFSTADLRDGYWNLKHCEACKEKTTFICSYSIYQFEVIPFGLMNAPSTFQRMIDRVLAGLDFVRFYLVDVAIFSEPFEEHLDHLRVVQGKKIPAHKRKAKVSKCWIAQRSVPLPAHIVNQNGVHVHPTKLKAYQNLRNPEPDSAEEFVWFADYYRRFIKGFVNKSDAGHTEPSVKKIDF